MKIIRLGLILVMLANLAYAQQDTTTVYRRTGFERDPIRARLKKVIEKKDSLWVVSLYAKKDVLFEQISFADEKTEVRQGPYKLFDNGTLKEEGQYSRGYKVGEWKKYHANKQLAEQSTFVWGKQWGAYKRFYDNAEIKEETNYQSGKKIGNRSIFYKGGKPALQEVYDEKGLLTGAYYDEQGNPAKGLVMTPPTYPGGTEAFYRFLGTSIKYPVNARKNGVAGTVRLSFTVTKEGKLENITVIDSPDDELSQEAVRVIRSSIYWFPGKELGEPINMKFTLPIKFSL
jgi:TonB family protein